MKKSHENFENHDIRKMRRKRMMMKLMEETMNAIKRMKPNVEKCLETMKVMKTWRRRCKTALLGFFPCKSS